MELLSTSEPIKYISLQQAKAYIDKIDFSMIINKMVTRDDWLEDEAQAVCKMYRNYLFLLKKYKDKFEVPPSEEIDEFWHQHILDTRKYHADCEAIFGGYLHHKPEYIFDKYNSLNKSMNHLFHNTQKLYFAEFGNTIIKCKKNGFNYLVQICIVKPIKKLLIK